MDALKSFTGGNKAENTGSSTSAVPAGQKDDYGDKGASFLNKKYLNDKLSRDQLEKITDAGREGIEKMTGKDIPDKFSN